MILISHRGNINGRNPEKENHPDYIQAALAAGYDVEIDVWYVNGWWLGHDAPTYPCPEHLLRKCWCHTKNAEALRQASNLRLPMYFWHDDDDYTITSHGYIWSHSHSPTLEKAIVVLPEVRNQSEQYRCAGVCSDYIERYKPRL